MNEKGKIEFRANITVRNQTTGAFVVRMEGNSQADLNDVTNNQGF